MNKLMLLGRLGKDAALSYTATGTPKSEFTIATDYGSRDKKETEWTSCVLWGDQAETLSQYLIRGKQCLIEGRLRTRSWEADGTKHYKTECIVNHVELVGSATPSAKPREDVDDLPFS